jgi:hypothetical protein
MHSDIIITNCDRLITLNKTAAEVTHSGMEAFFTVFRIKE